MIAGGASASHHWGRYTRFAGQRLKSTAPVGSMYNKAFWNKTMSYSSGRQFLQLPGPTNVPERVLRAMSRPTIDHRGPDFARLGLEVLAGLKEVFQTKGHVVIFPSSGTGAWEAALTNTLSPGDKILMFESGHFATLWIEMARRLGLDVDVVPTDWPSLRAKIGRAHV